MTESLAPSMAWALPLEGRAQMIDLRGRDEPDVPRIPGARAIALDELPSEIATLDRERPVVLVSGSGGTAAEAMRMFRAVGMTAYAVEGGMRAWLDAGLPVENDAGGAAPPQQSASPTT
jgi:rhodanese-related sulfurtransferase